MKTFRTIRFYSLVLIILSACIVIASNLWVINSTKRFIIQDDKEIEKDYTLAVVLGTSNRRGDGTPNPYFDERIRTAARLFHKKIVKQILVSGSNDSGYYNEPVRMKKALMVLNIPEGNIILDSHGTRTYSSIIRMHKIFGYNKFVIVTQRFHCYRALYISRHYGMNPVAIVAEEEPEPVKWFSGVQVREYFARVKVVFELYLRDVKLIQMLGSY